MMTKIERLKELRESLMEIAEENALDFIFSAMYINEKINNIENEIFVEKILELCRTGK
jgi:hypothetical protein